MAEQNSQLTAYTLAQQNKLAEYCRTGILPAELDVREDRVKQYRRLVFNVILDTLSSAYPISRTFLKPEKWHDLITDFFSNYPNQATQIWRMPYGLFDYLNNYENKWSEPYPFLAELIYFEWLEIELYSEDDIPARTDLSQDQIILNPHLRLLNLTFPFFKTSVKEAIEQPGQFFVLLYRNLTNFKVEFMEVSPLVYETINRLEDYDFHLLEALKYAAAQFNVFDESLIQQQHQLLELNLTKKGVILT